MNYPHVLAVLSQRIATRRHSIYCRRSAISHEAVPAEGGRHECPRDAPTDSDENEERRSECLVTARNALLPMDRHAREGSCSHLPRPLMPRSARHFHERASMGSGSFSSTGLGYQGPSVSLDGMTPALLSCEIRL